MLSFLLFNAALNLYSPYPTPTPLLAFFLRYPNPFARHVISTDILSRTIDSIGRLHTTRLILKRGLIPAWATRWLPGLPTKGGLDAWIVEESVIDPPKWGDGEEGLFPRLRCQQGNLNHRRFMHVIEGGEIKAGPDGSVHLPHASSSASCVDGEVVLTRTLGPPFIALPRKSDLIYRGPTSSERGSSHTARASLR